MDVKTALRVTAICSFAYVALFIGLQFYLPHLLKGDQAPSSTGHKDVDAAASLRFVHSHSDYFPTGPLLTAVSFVLLVPSVVGIFLVIRRYRPRMAQILLALGIVTVAGLSASQIVASNQWLMWARSYTSALTAAAKTKVVHGFENGVGGNQIAYLVADTGLALWFALVGVTFLRLQGTRSRIGWATIATGLLYVTQLPVLPVWVLGAGIGLWRLSAQGSDWSWARATVPSKQTVQPAPPEAVGTVVPRKRVASPPAHRSGRRRR